MHSCCQKRFCRIQISYIIVQRKTSPNQMENNRNELETLQASFSADLLNVTKPVLNVITISLGISSLR